MANILSFMILLLSFPFNCNEIYLNKTEHHFGSVTCGGVYTCSFTITNKSNTSIKISNIITGCGCTKAEYNKSRIKPGKSSTINVTYHSSALPQSFEELIYVYFLQQCDPIILKISGESKTHQKSNAEVFHERIGPFGMKSSTIDLGLLPIETHKEFQIGFANFSNQTEQFQLTPKSMNINVQPGMYVVKSGSIEYATVMLDLSDKLEWGRTTRTLELKYGDKMTKTITIKFTIIDNARKDNSSPRPLFFTRSISLGAVNAECLVTFNYKNEGLDIFHIHHIEYNSNRISIENALDTQPGEEGTITVSLHPNAMPKGKFIEELELITNSPYLPIVRLFVSGEIK